MKKICLLAILLFIALRNWSYEARVAQARASIDLVQQFSKLFPSALHGFGTSAGIGTDLSWESVGGLHGRYEVRMLFPVSVNVFTGRVTKIGPASFQALEVRSIKEYGLIEKSYTQNQRQFGEKEWDRIVHANGDFGTIDYLMIKDAPVERFYETLQRALP